MSARKLVYILGLLLGAALLGSASVVRAGSGQGSTRRAAAAQVEAITPRSLQMVDAAISTLGAGWSGMDAADRELFQRFFDPAGSGDIDDHFAATVLDNYRLIRAQLRSEVSVINAPRGVICREQRLYFTDLSRLYVCPYFFEEALELRKARTLIHEMAHMALLVLDRPYYDARSPTYARLTPYGPRVTRLPIAGPFLREALRGDTLNHPDAYAHYALHCAGYSSAHAQPRPLTEETVRAYAAPRSH